jgi:recombination protein RecA
MPRGRKKAEVKSEEKIVSSKPKKVSNLKHEECSLRDELEKAVLKDYAHLFTVMPDRRENLFKVNIPGLNYILGGGFPRGQIIHIYGPEGSGKTTLALHIMASIQEQGGKVYALDTENSMTSTAAEAVGVRYKDVRYLKNMPDGETALDIGEIAIRANLCDCLVYDSIAALSPKTVIDDSNKQRHIGNKALMLSVALEKLNNATVNSDAVIVFVNQLRANISKMPNARQWITAGGKALPYYANIGILVTRRGAITEKDKVIGQQVSLKVEKNKIAPPMKEVICNLIYGQGFRRDLDLIISAKDAGIIVQKGSWFEYNGESIGQGLEAVSEWAKAHEGFLDELEEKLYGNKDKGVAPLGVRDSEDEESKSAESAGAESHKDSSVDGAGESA